MSVDEQHAAFPKLYKAPAYARPPAPVDPSERPFDPDELPLLAEQTPEERALLQGALPGMPQAATMPASVAGAYLAPPPVPVGAAGVTAPPATVAGSYVAPPPVPETSESGPVAPAIMAAGTPIPESPAAEAAIPPALPMPIAPEPTDGALGLSPRPFSLRALAERLRGRSD